MKQQSATGERREKDRAAEVLSQQQQIIRVVVAVQTVEQRHQHCQHSAAVAAAVARHDQRRGIKTIAHQHKQKSTLAAEQWWTYDKNIFDSLFSAQTHDLSHFNGIRDFDSHPLYQCIYVVLMESRYRKTVHSIILFT